MKRKTFFTITIFILIINFLNAQTPREILQKTEERISSIPNCKIKTTWISITQSDTKVNTLIDYFQKNELDTLLGYSFVLQATAKDNNFKVIYDGYQGVHASEGKYKIVHDKEKLLTSIFDLLLNSRAIISTALSSDFVQIVQKRDTIIDQVKHYVIDISSPYLIGINYMIAKHETAKPATEIEFVINSGNYLPKILSSKYIYPPLYSDYNSINIYKADSIIEVSQMYPNFNYLEFIPKDYVASSPGEKTEISLNYKKPPEWNLKTLDGDSISLKSLKGKVLLIDFSSLYCGPCRLATPELIKLKNGFSGKNIEIIGIDNSSKTNIPALKKYVIEHNVNYPFLVNGNEVAESYKVVSIPTFIIINQKGQVAYYKMGYSADMMVEIKEEIEKLLKI